MCFDRQSTGLADVAALAQKQTGSAAFLQFGCVVAPNIIYRNRL
jgi:hypothetical protein